MEYLSKIKKFWSGWSVDSSRTTTTDSSSPSKSTPQDNNNNNNNNNNNLDIIIEEDNKSQKNDEIEMKKNDSFSQQKMSKDDNFDVYTVEDSSETLAGIALRCNMNINDLCLLNNLSNSDSSNFPQGTRLMVRPRSQQLDSSTIKMRERRSASDLPPRECKSTPGSLEKIDEVEEKNKKEESSTLKNDNKGKEKEEEEPDLNLIEPPKLYGSDRSNPTMLTSTQLSKIRQALPNYYRRKDWTLLYSTVEHGISLRTFYRKTKGKGPSILIIKTSKQEIFGAFVSESWESQGGFYGTGESFVFTFEPEFAFHLWSRKNDFFVNSTDSHLGVGAGGNFAIYMDSDLKYGSSGDCDTFDSPPLSEEKDFKVVEIEVWGFQGLGKKKKKKKNVQWLNSPFGNEHMRIASQSRSDIPSMLKKK